MVCDRKTLRRKISNSIFLKGARLMATASGTVQEKTTVPCDIKDKDSTNKYDLPAGVVWYEEIDVITDYENAFLNFGDFVSYDFNNDPRR